MPPRDWRLRVHDMLEAIGDIQSATTGLTYEDFVANRVTAHAVLYNFTIIGEALSALPAELRARHPEVPWRDIRNLRNVVTHVYFGVRMVTIWETIQNDLSPFAEQLRQLLRDERGPAEGEAT